MREDAKLYLTGHGSRVRGIRVSTVNDSHAEAAVQQGRGGPSGEMILQLRHGVWHESFPREQRILLRTSAQASA